MGNNRNKCYLLSDSQISYLLPKVCEGHDTSNCSICLSNELLNLVHVRSMLIWEIEGSAVRLEEDGSHVLPHFFHKTLNNQGKETIGHRRPLGGDSVPKAPN